MGYRPPLENSFTHEPLTRREREILALLAGDGSNQEIADQLFLSLSTVKGYIQQIYNKLCVSGRREAVQQAYTLGYLEPQQQATLPRLENHYHSGPLPFFSPTSKAARPYGKASQSGW